MSNYAALLDSLSAQLGAASVIVDPDEKLHYGQDRCRGGWPVDPCAVVFVRSVADVQAVVRACAEARVPIVPSGGRTGLAGAATATGGELLLSFERFRRRCEVDVQAQVVRCDPGVTIASVHEAAAAAGLRYPVDWAASGTAQVAGSIATNAGGIRVLRYGLTRRWVRDLDVVLASGEYLQLRGNVQKDNTGYDLRQLFIGSEGTLGLIVGASLGLVRPPADRVVAMCGLGDMRAVYSLFTRVHGELSTLSAFECFDAGCVDHVRAHRNRSGAEGSLSPMGSDDDFGQYVVLEVEVMRSGAEAKEAVFDDLALVLADAQEAGEIGDAVLASNATQAEGIWAWREDISESLHGHTPHKADVCLPVHQLDAFVAKWRELVEAKLSPAGIEARCFGHVGDGNLHLNLLRPAGMELRDFLDTCHGFDPELYALVADFEGSVSAEHGIGLLKREALKVQRAPHELASMRAIKAALDPLGLMNPGKIFG